MAVVADTHLPRGARRLPDACVEHLRTADLILHAGDLVSRSVLDELRSFGPPVHAVYGNVDEQTVRDELPARIVVEAAALRIGMVHNPGSARGREERLIRQFPECAAVVFGHTHVPVIERHAGVWLLNPGSPTERRRAPFHSMLILTIAARRLRASLIRLAR